MPYTGQFVVTHFFTNGMVKLKISATQITYNMHCITPYKYDTIVEDSSFKNVYEDINI